MEPLSGYSFFYDFSHLDGDCFQRFLELLSKDIGDDIAVIQFDQGAFHRAKTLDCPENIIPIFQPPHSQATFWGEDSPQKLAPELNPIERFWEFLKNNLEGENYPSLAQLKQKLTQLLETITPETIASLTSYNFILEALFSAAL